jgi:hypothetical protein
MSIRLDPRRLGLLKQLAAEKDLRPGDLVRSWVEERIDGERLGSPVAPTVGVSAQLEALVARIAALEEAAGITAPAAPVLAAPVPAAPREHPAAAEDVSDEPTPTQEEAAAAEPVTAAADEDGAADADAPVTPPTKRSRTKRVSAAPAGERVALHDEMIAVISERGPMTAGELATIITERGRYTPPRSGKALDAAMVSQRVSNPAYRGRFTRDAGRIGLAE